jgi:hypothetical protein
VKPGWLKAYASGRDSNSRTCENLVEPTRQYHPSEQRIRTRTSPALRGVSEMPAEKLMRDRHNRCGNTMGVTRPWRSDPQGRVVGMRMGFEAPAAFALDLVSKLFNPCRKKLSFI